MEKDPVVVEIQQRLNPYIERVGELEKSLEEKDNEIVILRLAVERLMAIKEEMSRPSRPSKARGSTKGGASKGRSDTRKGGRTATKRRR